MSEATEKKGLTEREAFEITIELFKEMHGEFEKVLEHRNELIAALRTAQSMLIEARNTPPSSDPRWAQIADVLVKARK